MTRIVIIGAGGHARVLVEALRACGEKIVGFVTEKPEEASGVMKGLVRVGSDEDVLTRGVRDDIRLVNGVGSTGQPDVRRAAFDRYRQAGFSFMSVVHPAAVIASDVNLGEGAQIMAAAVLQPGVRVGANAIVNTGAIVDHDGLIGDHAHVAPGACLAGNVSIGVAVHVGAGAVIIQNVRVGDNALVAAGAAVVQNLPAGSVAKGVPARPMES